MFTNILKDVKWLATLFTIKLYTIFFVPVSSHIQQIACHLIMVTTVLTLHCIAFYNVNIFVVFILHILSVYFY